MSSKPLTLMALVAALAACSAAARNTASVEQMSAAEPSLLGAPTIELAAPEAAAPPEAARPAAVERATTAPESMRADSAPRAAPAHEGAAISCDVRSRRSANGVIIHGRAFADRDIDGEYDLVITKSGGGNSSEINQSGPVSIAAGSSVTLGESEISIERGSRVRAVLTLRDANGQICRQTFRL